MASEHEPQLLSVQQVLAKDAYCIPVYQRNYAWGVDEITLLMADVQDSVERPDAQDYYIGTLVVLRAQPYRQHQHWHAAGAMGGGRWSAAADHVEFAGVGLARAGRCDCPPTDCRAANVDDTKQKVTN